MRFYISLIILFFVTSCGQKYASTDEDLIIDSYGRELIIPENANRIVCLNPASLRFISYFDEVNKIVAIERNEKGSNTPYYFAYPEIEKLSVIGNSRIVEAELIAASRADILISAFYNANQAKQLQQKTQIPVFSFHYGDVNKSMDDFYRVIQQFGKILHKENRAEDILNFIDSIEEDLQERTDQPDSIKSAYICGLAYRGVQGVSSTEPYFKSFGLVHVMNVASEMNEQLINPVKGSFIEVEQLAAWDADYIFIDASGYEMVRAAIHKNPEFFQDLKAVRENNIYLLLPYNWHALNYSSLLINAYYIGKVVYPDRFSDIQVKEKAAEIYSFFFGEDVYASMEETFGACRKVEKEELFEK